MANKNVVIDRKDYWHKWHTIADFPMYKVNRMGEVWSEFSGRLLKPIHDSYTLYNKEEAYHVYRKQLICDVFPEAHLHWTCVDDDTWEVEVIFSRSYVDTSITGEQFMENVKNGGKKNDRQI